MIVWTRQCQDGRACGKMTADGLWTAFIPDKQYVCNGCLIASYDKVLEYYSTSGCCNRDDMTTAYEEDSVAQALQMALKGEGVARYFSRTQEYFKDKKGKRVESWERNILDRSGKYPEWFWETLIFDSQPRLGVDEKRKPIETYEDTAHNGKGEARLKELNNS